MSELHIITNNHPRPIVYGFELTDEERREFDYYDGDEVMEREFVRYKGNVIDLGEFTMIDKHNPNLPAGFEKWDGYASDTYFSGVLIRHPREDWGEIDIDNVIMGWYYC